MKKHPGSILFLGVLAILGISWFLSNGQAERSTTSKFPTLREWLTKHSARPPLGDLQLPFESPENHSQRQLREGLGRGRYRRGVIDPGTRDVNGQAESILLTFLDGVTILKPGERADPPGLPVSSTAIVVGTVDNGKAFVSEDRTFVYSDYHVRIGEVIKADPEKPIRVGAQILAWVLGGSIRFPAGHLKHFVISGRGFPESGMQYVLFLRRTDPAIRDYAISTAYEVKDGVVLPLNDNEDSKQFEGMKVDEFLNSVRNAVTTTGVTNR
jgi:hypothetical protein